MAHQNNARKLPSSARDSELPIMKGPVKSREPLKEAAIRALNLCPTPQERKQHIVTISTSRNSNLVFRALVREPNPELQEPLATAYVGIVKEILAAYDVNTLAATDREILNIKLEKHTYVRKVQRELNMIETVCPLSQVAAEILGELKPWLMAAAQM